MLQFQYFEKAEEHDKDLRSWVQIIPPSPLLSVVQLRYCFERVLTIVGRIQQYADTKLEIETHQGEPRVVDKLSTSVGATEQLLLFSHCALLHHRVKLFIRHTLLSRYHLLYVFACKVPKIWFFSCCRFNHNCGY
jgi:hypothetical protein